MDNLTHSLVGLTAAKAGLERLSPWATTICVISANAADADNITLFFGDRWTQLQHHRGITHSIVGTIAIGLAVPVLAYVLERVVSSFRRKPPAIRLRGLLLASLIAAVSHPVLDWTNNYGVRPFLPWSGRWFYGDLVYIVDPYIWLLLGVVAFLSTSQTRLKVAGWSFLAISATVLIGFAARPQNPDSAPLRVALLIWITGMIAAAALRWYGVHQSMGPKAAVSVLLALVAYWTILGFAHRAALRDVESITAGLAAARGERVVGAAAMPTAASMFRWQGIAETNEAIYRFMVGPGVSHNAPATDGTVSRFPKPAGEAAMLADQSRLDRRAQILIAFARFPLARVDAENCIGQTLVRWADLRYTEPGRARINFSVDIPVDCPSR